MGNGLSMMLGGSISGSNYFFSSGWVSLGVIHGEAAGDQSGRSVSLSYDGSILAIGSPYNDGNGSNSGNVRVYENIAGSWTQIGQDIDGEAAGDQSGWSVSLNGDGDVVAVGAYQNDGNGSNSGHVRVYQYNGSTWDQTGADIDGEAAGDQSGALVHLSNANGAIMAIGAKNNDGTGADAGHVRVYQYVAGSWTQIGSDIDGEAADDLSGYSVSLSNDGATLAIGAYGNDGNGNASGHVRVYQNLSGTWTQVGADIDGEAGGDLSGYSVSLSNDGSILAIGSPYNDGNGSNSGHVRVYENIAGSWSQIGSDIDGEAAGDLSGHSVSLSADGTIVAIGAYLNDGNGSNSGHVRVYKNVAGSWSQIGSDINGEAAGDYSGTSVSLNSNGNIVAIGAIGNDAGKVHIYEFV